MKGNEEIKHGNVQSSKTESDFTETNETENFKTSKLNENLMLLLSRLSVFL